MRGVFISYRRDDTAGEARALCKDLVACLGKNSVFMDVDSIALGKDFRKVLDERLKSCDVMLVLIGDEWLTTTNESGELRLHDPGDFVRQEVLAALKRNISVTPILFQGVKMPSEEDLPHDIKGLAYRNGFVVRHSQWESDINEMVMRLGFVKKDDKPSIPLIKKLLIGIPFFLISLAFIVWFVFFSQWFEKTGTDTGDKVFPAYVVVDSAWKTKLEARTRVAELSHTYKNSGFIWIPDFDSLSGAQLYQAYVGPFQSRAEAEKATCDYVSRFKKNKREHYAVLVSNDTTAQERIFCR
uniref:TIR domain-containing protein n=1 Tax=uncultured Thiotrichaceae bacterium TaxID=298394 RepID=A0A6S6UMK2_9GAMM|nr:MAG: Unknown protein [uncultured Thiotrichaceae bacterium]